jgi:hypothetical protein
MDLINKYREIVKNLLKEYAEIFSEEKKVENQLILDEKKDHYLLLSLGWINQQRIHNCVIHIDIIDGQVWIQANNTDQLIARELVNAGIDKKDIVLGLQPPEMRKFTQYGIS